MTTPRGAPELVSSQAVPETTVNEQIRRTEAGAARFPVADRVTAPPGSCADGANYIIIATATGAFAGKEGKIATAVGVNAASGWYYRTLGTIDEGAVAYVQDEDVEYKWSGSAWATYSGQGYSPGGTDVALADGGTGASLADPNADRILFWDDSAAAVTWLTAGTGLTIAGTTISADTPGGGGSGSSGNAEYRITTNLTTYHWVAGTSAETDMMTYSLPGGTLETDGQAVRITARGTGSSTHNKTIKIYFGATVLTTIGPSTSIGYWEASVIVIRTGSATQLGYPFQGTNVSSGVGAPVSLTETLSGAITIKATGTSTGSSVNDEIVMTSLMVEVLP